MVETLKAVSELKDTLQSDQEQSISPIKQFKEDAKNCSNKIKCIVKKVLDKYLTIANECQKKEEDAYQKKLCTVKNFEEFQKKVGSERHDNLFVTLLMRLKEDIKEIGIIPCPSKRKDKDPFEPSVMVSTVVERIISEFKYDILIVYTIF